MPTVVDAYAAPSPHEPLVRTSITRRDVGAHDVFIEIAFAGICHSDIHTVRGDWGQVSYPLVPGHEIVGVVRAVGAAVTKHSVGDRVGVGCMVDSCRTCANCRSGHEQYCAAGNTQTYNSVDRDGTVTQGGYSTHVVVTEDFVLSIPDSLDLESAAPLLCAGITTYSPLVRWGAGPGMRVGIVGLGGLGHMAVKIAHAMGTAVTVLSQSLKKQEDALRMGARNLRATSDPATFADLAESLDLIINTVSAALPIDRYLELLARDGVLVNVGAPGVPVDVDIFSLILRRRSFAGSAIGGIGETDEMLEFCASNGVAPDVELISIDQVNQAYERVLDSDVRYRFVIDISTMAHG